MEPDSYKRELGGGFIDPTELPIFCPVFAQKWFLFLHERREDLCKNYLEKEYIQEYKSTRVQASANVFNLTSEGCRFLANVFNLTSEDADFLQIYFTLVVAFIFLISRLQICKLLLTLFFFRQN